MDSGRYRETQKHRGVIVPTLKFQPSPRSQCKTLKFTKEAGLKLGFQRMEQIKLTCPDG